MPGSAPSSCGPPNWWTSYPA
jgi:hypothetical protein